MARKGERGAGVLELPDATAQRPDHEHVVGRVVVQVVRKGPGDRGTERLPRSRRAPVPCRQLGKGGEDADVGADEDRVGRSCPGSRNEGDGEDLGDALRQQVVGDVSEGRATIHGPEDAGAIRDDDDVPVIRPDG